MQKTSQITVVSILCLIVIYISLLGFGILPEAFTSKAEHAPLHAIESITYTPPLWAISPFILLLLSIAILPLLSSTQIWWHNNKNRFLVVMVLSGITLLYYGFFHPGGLENHFTHELSSTHGLKTLWTAFSNAIFSEFIPFIVLLFSLYVISGGINLTGDLPARPATNTAFIAIGALLASFIGTTGAAMLLIRPLILTNTERQYKVHTIVFFIFSVCNCGGLLLPIGDPPLFLGYLRGVEFTWTLSLWPYWLLVNSYLLLIYFAWDLIVYRRETLRDLIRDERQVRPLQLSGSLNFFWLFGIVLSVAFILPGEFFLGTHFRAPVFLRETVMLMFVVVSLLTTNYNIRIRNRFDYYAITEVAVLFSGIFVCMQVPIEILHIKGPMLGINTSAEYFWFTGLLSSFLDNAPTYVVFFETAASLTPLQELPLVALSEDKFIMEHLLASISLAAVFMGANTYIGNGPNFMVKSIADSSGIKMPSFFSYIIYSTIVLAPILIVVAFLLP